MGNDVIGIDFDGFEMRVIYECVRYVNNEAMDCLFESVKYKGKYTPEEIKRVEKVAIETDRLLERLEKYIA